MLTFEIRRANKNETTFGLKERRHTLLVPVTFTLGLNNNARTGYHITQASMVIRIRKTSVRVTEFCIPLLDNFVFSLYF